jgi:beta-mannanase
VDDNKFAMGGQWSTYWYNGYIYGSEIARGLDVFQLVPSKFLTQNEIDAANTVHYEYLNVQDQPQVTYEKNMIVAKAYIDQLARGTSVPADKLAMLSAAIDAKNTKVLKQASGMLEKGAGSAATPADATRMKALAEILK